MIKDNILFVIEILFYLSIIVPSLISFNLVSILFVTNAFKFVFIGLFYLLFWDLIWDIYLIKRILLFLTEIEVCSSAISLLIIPECPGIHMIVIYLPNLVAWLRLFWILYSIQNMTTPCYVNLVCSYSEYTIVAIWTGLNWFEGLLKCLKNRYEWCT